MTIVNQHYIPQSSSIHLSTAIINLPELSSNKTEALRIIDKQFKLNKQINPLKQKKHRRKKGEADALSE